MISVIVPLYNCEKYIKECIDSLLCQNYKEFEIIVVNDGSTDNSLSVVERIKDSRIKIINQENRGLFHARISGLEAATGDVCLFLDADDLLCEDTLSSINPYFQDGYDCVMYKVATFCDDNENKVEEDPVFSNESVFSGKKIKELLTILLTTGRVNSIVCKAFRRDLIDTKKLTNYPRIAIGEDALFTLELFNHMNCGIYLNRSFYRYRQQLDSMSHKLTINIYYDNVYRFKMYHQVAEKVYSGVELVRIKEDIDKVTFKMITSMALNKRFGVKNYEMFCHIFTEIAMDKYFIELYERAYQKQNMLYRYVSKEIYKGKMFFIYQARRVSWIIGTCLKLFYKKVSN